MNIKLTVEDRAIFKSLEKQKSYNIEIASLFNNLCLYNDDNLIEYLKENEKSLDSTFLFQTILNIVDVDDIKMVRPYLERSFHVEDINKYLSNPYYQVVKPFEDKINDVKLATLKYEPYTFFPLDEIKVEKDNYREISSLGMFTKEYPYLALIDKEGIWMCITPNEMNTMKPYIDMAKGKVITFGLGLGYFAFMASNKKEVNEITIVEQDQHIIDIFSQNILPYFPNKDKIRIIKDEAIHYLENNDMNYDFIYYDLWHNPNDGLPLYIKLKQLEKKQSYYWLEESIIALLRRYMITLIEEQLKGFKEEMYTTTNNGDDEIISKLYFATKDKKITTYEELYNLLSNQQLLSLIK